MLRLALVSFLTFVAIIGGGCARPGPGDGRAASSTNYYFVTAGSTSFFRFGPQQVNGPDSTLPYGTILTVTRTSALGYWRVRLADGETGFVARSDIKPAPESLVAASKPSPTPAPVPYSAPTLPSSDSTPSVEPTALPMPTPQ